MPTESTFLKAKIAAATDETKAFPAEVDSPRTKTIDKYLEEHTLTIKKYAGSATLKSGELAFQEKAGETFTLPLAATANQLIGVVAALSGASTGKVTTSGGAVINGDFIAAQATITLAALQHVILQSDGTNWLIIAGEPKREQAYTIKSFTKAEAEAGVEPSASRMAYVILASGAEIGTPTVGGITIAESATGESSKLVPVLVPPGQKWKATVAIRAATLLL